MEKKRFFTFYRLFLIFVFLVFTFIGFAISNLARTPLNRKIAKCFVAQKIRPQQDCFDVFKTRRARSFSYKVSQAVKLKDNFSSVAVFFSEGQLLTFSAKGQFSASEDFPSDVPSFPAYSSDRLKSVIHANDRWIGLLSNVEPQCSWASVVNLSNGEVLFKSPCLPEAQLVDWSMIGGGSTLYKDGFLLALGTPESKGFAIRPLAQNDESPFGKILYFAWQEMDQTFKVSFFSKGLRSPVGFANEAGQTFLVDQKRNLGDEIFTVLENQNFAWPPQNILTPPSLSPENEAPTPPAEALFAMPESKGATDIISCPPKLSTHFYPQQCLLIAAPEQEAIKLLVLDRRWQRAISLESLPIGLRVEKFARHLHSNRSFFTDSSVVVSTAQAGLIRLDFQDFK